MVVRDLYKHIEGLIYPPIVKITPFKGVSNEDMQQETLRGMAIGEHDDGTRIIYDIVAKAVNQ